ncbi:MAG TPA: alcohol dehydrogenase family protein [Denitromonas sp.]|uniref:alcohol dehydrogenase family protein n=1 Tax=Denitromonas sp. TaxID=2734609 RepID=UPI001DE78AD9|nr:alcohol dehydrogenase family protein [Rhodocyclaceae bacterium]MCP5220186.1 alcohol dehydrogenase family protein [Zoogloeaceae bacterium]HQU87511.1 alcohol dehydrogenase family protein [Denitromonas sp.]HQV13419.1 alcohol dehydrogenase family protein [Denitromonas sp.]
MNPQPTTMRGVQLIGHGGMEMLKVSTDIPVPTPAPGEVLIRVSAAGVNNTDINTRIGWYSKNDNAADDASWTGEALKLPRIQGADVCGHIVAVGNGVDTSRIGERILIEPCLREAGGKVREQPWYFGSECDGGFAEFTAVASRHAHAINSPLTDVELASFPCSYSTAENMLTRSQVTPGERVLITGASGGVGSAAIQLAKARSAYVLAVSTPSKAPALRDLGADEVIPRDAVLTDIIGANSIDVVIDLVAGPQWPQYLDVLRPGGRYAVSGAIAGPIVDLDVRTLYLKDLSLFGCTVLGTDVFQGLIRWIEQGKIAPVVAHRFPLEQICDAQRLFLEKKHVGKIVLNIRDDAQ